MYIDCQPWHEYVIDICVNCFYASSDLEIDVAVLRCSTETFRLFKKCQSAGLYA